ARRAGRPATGRDGPRRDAVATRMARQADAAGPAVRAGYRPGAGPVALGSAAAPRRDVERARREPPADDQSVARLSGEPEHAGADRVVHRRVHRLRDTGARGRATAARAGPARRARRTPAPARRAGAGTRAAAG